MCVGGGGREGERGGRLTVYSCPGAACTVSVMYVCGEGGGEGERGGGGETYSV